MDTRGSSDIVEVELDTFSEYSLSPVFSNVLNSACVPVKDSIVVHFA